MVNINGFCANVIKEKKNKFLGTFHIGYVYNMENFDKKSIGFFKCTIDKDDNKILNKSSEYTVLLSDDAFVLLEFLDKENKKAKVAFWCNIYSITDIKIKKKNKIVSLNCFKENCIGYNISLFMEINILVSFRDKIIEKIGRNNINFSNIKQNKGNIITMDKISKMTITEIGSKINEFQKLTEENNPDDYIIKSYILLLEKAVDEYEYIGDQRKHKEYKKILKNAIIKFSPNNKLKEDNQNNKENDDQNNVDDSDDED